MAGILLVRDVMSRLVRTVRVDASVREAVKKMNKFGIGSVVVMQGNRPVGIVTERDVLKRIVEPCMDPRVVSVREVMSAPLTTIESTVSIEDAARLMAREKIKKLPVMEKGKLTGIVTSTDLMRIEPKLFSLLQELQRKKSSAVET